MVDGGHCVASLFYNGMPYGMNMLLRSSSVLLALGVGCFLLACTGATAPYDGYKIYNVIPQTRAHNDLLAELAKQEEIYDFFTLSKLPKHAARVMIPPSVQSSFVALMREHNIEFEIFNENVGASVERDFEANRLLRQTMPYAGKGRLSTERYHTHDEINQYIEDLAELYPTRVTIKQVGKSFEGRKMKTIAITNGDGRTNKNVIFADGGFHAREWISPAAVLYVIEQLVEKFEENADLLKDYDWLILPVANPDGYEHSQTSSTARIWRKTRQPYKYLGQTCKGADPNRNFGFHWNEEGASSIPCMDTYAGPNAFSEPESKVVRDIMHSLVGRGIMYLTIHSYGNYLLYPWGWSSDLPDTWRDLDEVARAGGDAIFEATGTEYAVGSATNVLYVAAGASDDYAFSVGFPISITMELTGGGTTGFDPPPSSIDGFVKETWIGIRAMAKKVVAKYPLVN